MSTITNSFNLMINTASATDSSQNSASIFPQVGTSTGLAATVARHASQFHSKSQFSQDLAKLQKTDPSFVQTLQNNVQTAVKSAQSQGQSGSALAAVAQQAVQATFSNASSSDQSAINSAFGTQIYNSNGSVNTSALQAILGGNSSSTSSNGSNQNGVILPSQLLSGSSSVTAYRSDPIPGTNSAASNVVVRTTGSQNFQNDQSNNGRDSSGGVNLAI